MPCLLLMTAILIGYYYNNQSLIIGTLLMLAIFFMFNNMKNAFYILLFFIPFNNILKFTPDSFAFLSILSIEFLFIAVVEAARNNYKINMTLVIQALFLLMLSFISFEMNSNHLIELLVNFIILFNIIFLCAVKEDISHKKAILSFIFGFIGASLTGLVIGSLPHMSVFIDNHPASRNFTTIVRFSGVDKDPNYFGFYALFAISLLITYNYNKKNRLLAGCLLLGLITLGYMSYSKMFLLIFIVMLTVALLTNINYLIKNAKYILYYLPLIILGCYLFIQKITTHIIAPYLDRFIYSVDGGELTNGRLEIALLYGKMIMSDLSIMMIGTGFFRDDQELTLATHNTYITIFYSFGLIGTVVLLSFYHHVFTQIKRGVLVNRQHKMLVLLEYYPLLVMLLTMLSLDLIYMRFFPYLLFLSLLLIHNDE